MDAFGARIRIQAARPTISRPTANCIIRSITPEPGEELGGQGTSVRAI